jgi:Tfp pilus assembly protein PilF
MADFIAKCDNPKRTLQALADAINSDPVFTADLFFQRGQVELGLKDYKGALKDFSDAILKEPMRYKYYLGRAVVYRKMGNPFMAEKDIATARYTSRDVPAQVEFDDDTNSQR